MRNLAAAARLASAAWLVTILACDGSGAVADGQTLAGYRADARVHKVQLGAEQAAELERRGAKVLGDYGAFKLLQVDDAALTALPAAPGAEVRDDYDHLLLNAGTIDTASPHGQSLRGVVLPPSGSRFHLVQFVGPIQPEWYKALEATGVRIVSYIPNNAYLVYGDAVALGGMRNLTASSRAIQWDGAYLDDYKLDPSIYSQQTEAYSIQLVKDEAPNSETLSLVRGLQRREGVVQEALGYVNVVAYLDRDALFQLARRPDVVSIQARPEPKLLDERQDMIISGNLTGSTPTGPGFLAWLTAKGFTQAQFTASGFGVDVTDSGVDNGTQVPNHFGLYVNGDVSSQSRVVYNRLEGTPHSGSTIQGCDGHGNIDTHIVAGFGNQTAAPFVDGAGYLYGLGVAPFVKVGSSVIFDPNTFTSPNYEDLQARAYRDGMRISTNSWGAASPIYSTDSQRYDALVRDAQPASSAVGTPGNQEMVILFAAGNSGSGGGTVGYPGSAKNVITVGASENVHPFGASDRCGVPDTDANGALDVVGFSSRGPTADGRKKPDLMAPGTHITGGVAQADGQRANPPGNPNGQANSCFNGGGVCGGPGGIYFPTTGQQWFTASSGTSHSTPATAGAAALLRQYFINQGRTPPSPAMTKAFLMNSTRYMTGTGANDTLYSNSQGMGLLDLGMALDGTARILEDQTDANLFTATGQTRTFTGSAAEGSKPFRVTLAWTDAPGSTSGSAWRNNLDLTVTINGNTYKGNVFSGASSVTGGTADVSNNVESVFLPAGTTGPFTVTVTAANINSDGVPGNATALDQDFALVVYNTCANIPAAPAGATATVNGNNRVDVSWTPGAATSFNVYRATTAGGPYTRLATVAAPPYADTDVSGGTRYYYVVRAVDCAESANSNEASALATGACRLPPTFAGLATATNTQQSTCTNTLSWSAGTPACGGGLSYSVYRSTSPTFTPALGNRIATGVGGTSFSDNLNLVSGTTYYYVVRATETSTATVEETNTVRRSSAPSGAVSPGSTYFDDLDGTRPPSASAYWIPQTIAGSSGTMNVVGNCHYQSATNAYRVGPTGVSCGTGYPNSQQSQLTLGGDGTVSSGINGFFIPSSTSNPTMTFNVGYSLETGYDGVYLVYSTTGATGPWTAIGDTTSASQPFISAGGYDTTLIAAPSIRIWSSRNMGPNGALKPVTVNLNSLAGQTVWFGYRFYTDGSVVDEGFFVDDVRVTAATVAACTTNTPPPGPAVSYRISGLPASVGAGNATTFTVTALDVVGQTSTDYSGTATFTSTDAQAVLPANASFTAGVASNLPITFRTIGTQSVSANDVANSALTGSGGTTVTPGTPSRVVFRTQPSNTVAGVSIAPAVQVALVDQFGNTVSSAPATSVTVALGTNPGGGALGGTLTATTVNGVATFSNLSLNKTGTGYTLTAAATGLAGATSSAFNITPAAATKLAFSVHPGTTAAGVPIAPAPRVSLLDAFDNVSTSTANVTVALGTNPAGGTLLGTATVAAVSGVATFSNVSVDKVGGGYTLVATSGSLTRVTSSAFNVTPGAPHRVLFTSQPSDVVAGGPFAPVAVTVYDRYANVATQATLPVAVSLGNNPFNAMLAGTTVVNAVNGVATFSDLRVNRAGVNYTLVAGSSGLYNDTSVGFDVTSGPPARLAFTAQPGLSTAGATFSPAVQVTVQDGFGNPIPGAANDITIAIGNNPSGAPLNGTTTRAAVNGVATFSDLTIRRTGTSYTLTASATGLGTATTAPFEVVPGAPAGLGFVVPPTLAKAGVVVAPAVRVAVVDLLGNVVTSGSETVTVALGTNPAGASLTGNTTAPSVNGVASFPDLVISRPGSGFTLVASAGTTTPVTSPAFNVTAGPLTRLVFKAGPGAPAAGAAMGPVRVELQDALGTPLTTQTAEVTLALGSNPEGGVLLGTTTVTTVNGVATFNDVSIRKAGEGYSLVASAAGFGGATTSAFNVSAGAASSYDVAVPSSIGAGQEVTVSATAYDAYGNIASAYNGAVRATSSDTEAVLPANRAFTAGVLSGLKVTFRTAGLATLTLADVERGNVGGTAQINVTPYAQPTASVVDPTEGTVVSGKVTISARGAVAPGTTLRSLSILVDGVVVATGTEATLTGTWDSSTAVNGPHTFSAVISDSAGNVTTSAPVGVTSKGGRSGCGCGATSGADASLVLAALAALRYAGLRRRERKA